MVSSKKEKCNIVIKILILKSSLYQFTLHGNDINAISRSLCAFTNIFFLHTYICSARIQRFSRAGPRGRAREWATLGVHPLSWLLSNNRLEEVCGTLTKGTFSSRLLLSNQDKGCTPSVAHSLPLPLPPGFCSTCQLCSRLSFDRASSKMGLDITANFKLYGLWSRHFTFLFAIHHNNRGFARSGTYTRTILSCSLVSFLYSTVWRKTTKHTDIWDLLHNRI